MPCVDFISFATRFNAAKGDPRTMSIMSNGGDEKLGIEDFMVLTPGVQFEKVKDINESKISTPGSSEALMAAMHAWAGHYTDAPIAFGTMGKSLGLETMGGVKRIAEGSSTAKSKTSIFSPAKVNSNPGAITINEDGVKRRPKRKQGVACDSCRLRRIRCDITERLDGTGCSRCEDKSINCTDVYIQSKRKDKSIPIGKTSEQLEASGSLDQGETEDFEGGNVSRTQGSTSPETLPGVGPNSWRGEALEMKDWANSGPQAPFKNGGGNGREMLKWGKAREAFCHNLLTRALGLVEKHDLMRKPSVEAIQTLLILLSIVEMIDTDLARSEYLGMLNVCLSSTPVQSDD